MTAVAQSQLNPLANAFIPAIRKNGLQKKTIQYSTEKKKTTGQGSRNDRKSEHKKCKEMAITLDIRKNPAWSDIFFFGSISSMLNVFLNYKFIVKTPACMTENSRLPMLQECPRDDQKELKKSNADLIETPKEVSEERIQCNCPAMFGWIIPPDFIGNPFNFKFECNKKYPHNSNSIEQESDVDKLDSRDKKINDLTLEQCYSEIKDILTDVYKSISMDSDSTSKSEEKCEIDLPDVSDCEMHDEEETKSKRFSSDSTSEVTNKPELVDDGCHPLLQSAPVTREEDAKELVEKVEKILERSLCSSLPEFLDSVTHDTLSVCDPPCSVWCEFLPSAAKDTFKKYIQKSGSSKILNEACHQRWSSQHRPIYKRSFSADDAPMFGQFTRGSNQTSSVESREMLLLRRKDPLNYFRIRSSGELINRKKHGSSDLTNRQIFANSNVEESSMWGKFNGVDSLWQPLPECLPVNIYQKNCYKRS